MLTQGGSKDIFLNWDMPGSKVGSIVMKDIENGNLEFNLYACYIVLIESSEITKLKIENLSKTSVTGKLRIKDSSISNFSYVGPIKSFTKKHKGNHQNMNFPLR